MADFPSDDPTCWPCGAAAVGVPVTVIAKAHPPLDPLGHRVEHRGGRDRLIIHVPRCAACRRRRRMESGIVIAAMLAGSFLGQILIPMVWPQLGATPPLDPSIDRTGSIAEAIGAAAGVVIALLAIALHRRSLKIRNLYEYPAVVKARAIGWQLQSENG